MRLGALGKLVAATGLALGALAACSPQPSAEGCEPADADTVNRIAAQLVDDGVLRNGTVRTEGDRLFVSVEYQTAEQAEDDDDGNILTFHELGPGLYESVDQRAREETTWPESELDARTEGVIESRGCTRLAREDTDETTAEDS